MKKKILTPLAAALGTVFAISLTATPVAAAENPFGMSDLANGQQIAWGDKPAEGKKEGKCGEGKKADTKTQEGKCGEDKCGGT